MFKALKNYTMRRTPTTSEPVGPTWSTDRLISTRSHRRQIRPRDCWVPLPLPTVAVFQSIPSDTWKGREDDGNLSARSSIRLRDLEFRSNGHAPSQWRCPTMVNYGERKWLRTHIYYWLQEFPSLLGPNNGIIDGNRKIRKSPKFFVRKTSQ